MKIEEQTNEEIVAAIEAGFPLCITEEPYVQRIIIENFETGEKLMEIWLDKDGTFEYTVDGDGTG